MTRLIPPPPPALELALGVLEPPVHATATSTKEVASTIRAERFMEGLPSSREHDRAGEVTGVVGVQAARLREYDGRSMDQDELGHRIEQRGHDGRPDGSSVVGDPL